MRKILITFGGRAYDERTKELVERAPCLGADDVWVYDDLWLTNTEFYRRNSWLWEHHGDLQNVKRGFGWFAWKSIIIQDALSRLETGDMLLYLDGDTHPISDFSMLYDECHRIGGMMFFEAQGCVQAHWCKRDCFIVMAQDEPRYHNAQHAVARFMLFEKGSHQADDFLGEWAAYCVNPLATTFDPSVLGKPELPGFQEHRTEQAIMTNLVHKYGLPLYREACQFGDHGTKSRDLYPQTLFHQVGVPRHAHEARPIDGSRYRNVPARYAK